MPYTKIVYCLQRHKNKQKCFLLYTALTFPKLWLFYMITSGLYKPKLPQKYVSFQPKIESKSRNAFSLSVSVININWNVTWHLNLIDKKILLLFDILRSRCVCVCGGWIKKCIQEEESTARLYKDTPWQNNHDIWICTNIFICKYQQ